MMSDIACRISRSNRPCLVCPGRMDLIEASPRYSLFNGLPLCNSESIDCLDCPKCGFSTTTADYQYLHMCKKQRHGMFYSSSCQVKSLPTRKSSDYKIDTITENKEKLGYECSSCHEKVSTYWQFCPHCGRRNELAVSGFNGRSPSPSSKVIQGGSVDSGCSGDSGIVRMVTPPKRTTSTKTYSTNISSIISL